ncbi:hypothetical protein [Geomonas anaerohicana]|uniref:Doubled CXXCH motif domain-containing protein n=1 Tax=Geomonas anaerohicana TaxID=2798583 RepID=A0ABS0YGW1_9BACT|nr:hypothetical protein [Geomonas anaerohicana]MBJ6751535.1 hypothetical protein [Geomonas anaerohicana]
MKKQFVAVAAVAGLALGAAVAQGANSSGSSIVGSVHDLSNSGTGVAISDYGMTKSDPGKRLCAFCHSPHHSAETNQNLATTVNFLGGNGTVNAATGEVTGGTTAQYKIYAPLWSRTTNVGDYGTYVSQTFDPARQGKAYDPLIGPSRLCLSCHDGNIAVDSYYGATGAAATDTGDLFGGKSGGLGKSSIGIAGGIVGAGGGLTNDHPIGMRYSDYEGSTDPNGNPYELNQVTTKFPRTSGTPTNTIKSVLYTDPSDTNVNGFVTCASCHDVHNGTAVGNQPVAYDGQTAMKGFLLYGTQVGSAFCLTCHKK